MRPLLCVCCVLALSLASPSESEGCRFLQRLREHSSHRESNRSRSVRREHHEPEVATECENGVCKKKTTERSLLKAQSSDL